MNSGVLNCFKGAGYPHRTPALSQGSTNILRAFSSRRAGYSRGAVQLLLLVSACLGGCGAEQPAGLAGGGQVRFSELGGRWLLINYWAEWCAPCRDEIPELNELHEHRDEHGVAVFGVNYDEIRGEKLVEVMGRMDIRFPVLTEDPRARWGYGQPDVLPVTVVIGPDGRLRRRLTGPQTLEELLAAIGMPKDVPPGPTAPASE